MKLTEYEINLLDNLFLKETNSLREIPDQEASQKLGETLSLRNKLFRTLARLTDNRP